MGGMSDQRQEGCVFCAIIAGEAEASVVLSDDRVMAFMDLGGDISVKSGV